MILYENETELLRQFKGLWIVTGDDWIDSLKFNRQLMFLRSNGKQFARIPTRKSSDTAFEFKFVTTEQYFCVGFLPRTNCGTCYENNIVPISE